jgi:eukaryotic-like serine/threonine-protein kinase
MKGYELLERLARGHAYDTYDAWSHERGCRVVVRMLREDRPEHRRDLLREGRLLRRLAHPHIVRAYETRRRPPMVVLETLGGATLARLLEDGPLDEDDALEMGRQLCSAVGYLHRQGWLHLDIKPSNLIADGGRLKLIDLSIAQRPGPIDAGTGTERYMAPEQECGGRVGPAADVWGIGRVLQEAGLDEIAPRCLRPDPADRPLLQWLHATLDGARTPDPQPTP